MSRRTRHKRTRPRRSKRTGISPPSRSQGKQEGHRWTEEYIEKLREIHRTRTTHAQATDEALAAPLAPTPEVWMKQPDRYDVHGVDYPEEKTPEDKRGLSPHKRQTKGLTKKQEAQLRERHARILGEVIPKATKEELDRIAEKAVSEEWIKPDDGPEEALQRVAPRAQAELTKLRVPKKPEPKPEPKPAVEEGDLPPRGTGLETGRAGQRRNGKPRTEEEREERHREKPKPEPKTKTRTESYMFYSDPGHGWLRVPVKKLEELGIAEEISNASHRKGQYVYLEEDRDASIFIREMEGRGVEVKVKDKVSEGESSIRDYDPYHGPRFQKHRKIIADAKTVKELEEIKKDLPGTARLTEQEIEVLQRYADLYIEKLQGKPVEPETIRRAEKPPEPEPTTKVYDEHVERNIKGILDAKKDVTRAEIEKMIEGKKDELGYIWSPSTAVDSIAHDLGVGVSFYEELENRKFWAYSGEDGDLYRKHGLGGWRVQVYWGSDLAIQKKVKDWAGTRWITAADFDTETMEDKQLAIDFMDRWMKDPSILDEQVKSYEPLTLERLKKEIPAPELEPAPEPEPASLKKPTASKTRFNKDSGMYEIEIHDPAGEKTVKQFSTPDKAEQHRRLINDNPGWPLEGFKERRGYKRGAPKYRIIAWNVKSRGQEALKYEVYDRDKSERKGQNLVAMDTIEYEEAPDRERIIEDLIKEAPEGTSHLVEFTVTPNWTLALSVVDRIVPAGPVGDRDGKWMIWFTGRDQDPREGTGSRIFDTYEEALEFAKEGRGEYHQSGGDREGLWVPVTAPPTLSEELRDFPGERARFKVDPRPQYEGKWDSDRKQMEYRWVFSNEIGGETYTVEELRAARQAGKQSRSEKAEAAKHSKTLTYRKGSRRKPWDRKAQPLAQAVVFNSNAIIEAEGDRMTIEGMDASHVALVRLKNLPNDMGIPEGKYEVEDRSLDSRVTHRRHPKKLHWDNVNRILKVSNEDQESNIDYEKVDDFHDRFPEPKIIFHVKADVDLEALEKAASQKGVEHIALKATEARSALDSSLTYEATKTETKKRPPDEYHAYEWEEEVETPLSEPVGETIREACVEDEANATYTASYIDDHVGALLKAGFRDATLEYATDMPLKITARRDDGAEAEFWLAPCIGV